MFKIYILKKNDIPFYVGKATNVVRRKHKHYTTYGTEIKLEIIDEVEDWKYWEEFYIWLFRSWGFVLENKNFGGGGPTSYTEEQKAKMRKPRKKGTGAKISKTLKERNHSKYYTEEIRLKMKEKLKGSHKGPFTKIHIKNLTNSHRKRAKKLLMYNFQGKFIKEWESKGQAAEWIIKNNKRALGQNIPSQIKDCCMGRMISCWDYIWRYKNSKIPIIPKFNIIYQFDLNKNLLRNFKSLKELKHWLKINRPKNNFNGISNSIKYKSQQRIYKSGNNYYSINNKI